jgi:hypothetical protein
LEVAEVEMCVDWWKSRSDEYRRNHLHLHTRQTRQPLRVSLYVGNLLSDNVVSRRLTISRRIVATTTSVAGTGAPSTSSATYTLTSEPTKTTSGRRDETHSTVITLSTVFGLVCFGFSSFLSDLFEVSEQSCDFGCPVSDYSSA